MSKPREPIQRPGSLVDEITTRLRSDILTGEFEPGQRVGVASLARELGVSHIPVREAVRRLEAESLIATEPHRGLVVADVRPDELGEIYDLRRLIERDVARRAVERYTDDDIRRIQESLARLLEADPGDERGNFWEAHREFHETVLSPGMTAWTERILGLLWQSAERYARLAALAFGSLEQAHPEHRALAEAAAAKDRDMLCHTLVEHLSTTERRVARGFQSAVEQGGAR